MRINVEDSGVNVRAPRRSPGAREKTAVNMTIIMSMNMTSCEQLRQPTHLQNLDFMQFENSVDNVQFMSERRCFPIQIGIHSYKCGANLADARDLSKRV